MSERLNDPDVVGREYSTVERLAQRRLDRTGWLRAFEPVASMLAAVAEVRPQRVLDTGCGTGELAELVAAPEVVCVDLSAAAVEAARSRGLDAEVADVQSLPFGHVRRADRTADRTGGAVSVSRSAAELRLGR